MNLNFKKWGDMHTSVYFIAFIGWMPPKTVNIRAALNQKEC